jgi:hypothetical protein
MLSETRPPDSRLQGKNSLAQLIEAAREQIPSKEPIRELHTKSLLEVQAGLDGDLVPLVAERLETVRSLCSRLRFYGEGFSVLDPARRGKPGFLDIRGALNQELEALGPFAALLGDTSHRPDGYTVGDLRRHAEIGRELWSTLLASSGLPSTERGDQHRRFSAAHVRQLAAAAREHGTQKALEAADKWLSLINESPVAPKGPTETDI